VLIVSTSGASACHISNGGLAYRAGIKGEQ